MNLNLISDGSVQYTYCTRTYIVHTHTYRHTCARNEAHPHCSIRMANAFIAFEYIKLHALYPANARHHCSSSASSAQARTLTENMYIRMYMPMYLYMIYADLLLQHHRTLCTYPIFFHFVLFAILPLNMCPQNHIERAINTRSDIYKMSEKVVYL